MELTLELQLLLSDAMKTKTIFVNCSRRVTEKNNVKFFKCDFFFVSGGIFISFKCDLFVSGGIFLSFKCDLFVSGGIFISFKCDLFVSGGIFKCSAIGIGGL